MQRSLIASSANGSKVAGDGVPPRAVDHPVEAERPPPTPEEIAQDRETRRRLIETGLLVPREQRRSRDVAGRRLIRLDDLGRAAAVCCLKARGEDCIQ